VAKALVKKHDSVLGGIANARVVFRLPAIPRKTDLMMGHHLITKLVAGTPSTQLVSALFGASKKDRVIAYAHSFAAVEGLPNATCATLGIVTTVELGNVFATYAPNDAAVCASYCAFMTRVGKLLLVAVRTNGDTARTSQSRQFSRIKGKFGAFLKIEIGNVGNARRPAATTLCSVS
jgi:hypothetical protein